MEIPVDGDRTLIALPVLFAITLPAPADVPPIVDEVAFQISIAVPLA